MPYDRFPIRIGTDRDPENEPSPADKLRRVVASKVATLEAFATENVAWITAHEQQDDIAMKDVYWAGLALTEFGLYEDTSASIALLNDKYQQSVWEYGHITAYRDLLSHTLGSDQFGVSTTALLKWGKQLIHDRPVETYGFILRSAVSPETDADIEHAAYAFWPVVQYSTSELMAIADAHQFPRRIRETLMKISGTYQQALTQTKSSLFNPDARYFQVALDVYEDILHSSTDPQLELFLEQIVGMTTDEGRRNAYRKAKELALQDVHPELFLDMIARIETTYSGTFGEVDEVYELLGLVDRDDATVDDSAYIAVHAAKRKFLGLMKDAEGSLPLDDDTDEGELLLRDRTIRYAKSKYATCVRFEALAGNESQLPIEVSLYKDGSYEWNFLRLDTETPVLFNAVIRAAGRAIDEVLASLERPTSAIPRVPASPKSRNDDPIYEMRKEVRQAAVEVAAVELPAAKPAPKQKRLAVEFPDHLRTGVDEEVLRLADSAIAKYVDGLDNVKKMLYKRSKRGNTLYRFRSGDGRVVLELVDGKLVVYQIDWRRDAY
jgi:hypothetical protein